MKPKPKRASRSELLNRIIRTAALKFSTNGSIDRLAEVAKVSGEAIRRSIRHGEFSVGLASALELAVGRDAIKREVLCSKLSAPDRG